MIKVENLDSFNSQIEELFEKKDEKELIRLLNSNKEYLDCILSDGDNILHKAVKLNLPLIAYFLMSRTGGMELVSQPDKEGYCPVSYAAAYFRIKILAILKVFISLYHNSMKSVNFLNHSLETLFPEGTRQNINSVNMEDLQCEYEPLVQACLNKNNNSIFLMEYFTPFFIFHNSHTPNSNSDSENSALLVKKKN